MVQHGLGKPRKRRQLGVVTHGIGPTLRWRHRERPKSGAKGRTRRRTVAGKQPSQRLGWEAIAKALKLDVSEKVHRTKIAELLKVWIKNGMFVRVDKQDPKRRETHPCIEVAQWATD